MLVVVRPLAGSLVVVAWMIIAAIFDPPLSGDALTMFGMMFFIAMAFGWLSGLLPAILAAIAWKFVEPRVSGWGRVMAALAVGAVSSMIAAWPVFIFYFRATQITPEGLAVLGFIGAIAMAATALQRRKTA